MLLDAFDHTCSIVVRPLDVYCCLFSFENVLMQCAASVALFLISKNRFKCFHWNLKKYSI